jgi:hypothetical protein
VAVFLILLAFLGILAIAVAVSMSAHADALQAQAAIEAARAAQIAAAGQAVNSALLTALVVATGFTLLAVLIVLAYLVYTRQKQKAGKWLPGPNARWGRVDDAPRPVALPQGDPLQQLVQLELLRYLRQMNTSPVRPSLPQREAAYLPHPEEDEDDEPLW